MSLPVVVRAMETVQWAQPALMALALNLVAWAIKTVRQASFARAVHASWTKGLALTILIVPPMKHVLGGAAKRVSNVQ